MSWLRFASDWRDGPFQRHPWLPWLVVGLACFALWGAQPHRGETYVRVGTRPDAPAKLTHARDAGRR